jgi:hypothetical protein
MVLHLIDRSTAASPFCHRRVSPFDEPRRQASSAPFQCISEFLTSHWSCRTSSPHCQSPRTPMSSAPLHRHSRLMRASAQNLASPMRRGSKRLVGCSCSSVGHRSPAADHTKCAQCHSGCAPWLRAVGRPDCSWATPGQASSITVAARPMGQPRGLWVT